jgi:predicted DNA-binding transcriptional regulator YafY
MQASRLLNILMLLQAQGRLSAPALAQALEVSPRTILRDIDALSAAGVPVWGERGRQGGFQLREGWSTRLTGLTEPESQALLLAGLPAAATALGLGGPAASARLKMLASLPAEWRASASKVGERLHVDPVDWYRAAETPRWLREVAQAVWSGQRIAVRYESWSGQAERELEPLGLVLKAGTWYLAARRYGHSAVRNYRLAGVLALRGVKGRFRRPAGFDLAAHWRDSAAQFENQQQPLLARVSVSERAMAWLLNARTPFEAVPHDGPAAPGREGWLTVQLRLESIEHGARRLLAMGAQVQVLAPRTLVAAMTAELVALRALYPP